MSNWRENLSFIYALCFVDYVWNLKDGCIAVIKEMMTTRIFLWDASWSMMKKKKEARRYPTHRNAFMHQDYHMRLALNVHKECICPSRLFSLQFTDYCFDLKWWFISVIKICGSQQNDLEFLVMESLRMIAFWWSANYSVDPQKKKTTRKRSSFRRISSGIDYLLPEFVSLRGDVEICAILLQWSWRC